MLTGANPNLFYLSLTLIVAGLMLMSLAKAVFGGILQNRITKAQEAVDGRSHDLLGGGFGGGFGDMGRRQEALRSTMVKAGRLIAIGNGLYYLCGLIVITGGLGLIIYLVQRYGVV